jgi:FtsP/CotA-like multicopper oxidase with cupredoxin domain
MKFYWLPLVALLVLFGATPGHATYTQQCPPDADGIDTDGDGDPNNDHVCIHLGAGDGYTVMADGYPQYIFSFSRFTGVDPAEVGKMWFEGGNMQAANFPAPTIDVKEGQKLYLTLSNVGMMDRPDLFDPHTVHWHGFPQASSFFDGVPDASVSVNMGTSFTYFYDIIEPGTFMYHCHVEATEHMQMGMLGNLYVRPKQDNTPVGNAVPGGVYVMQPGDHFAYNDGDGSTRYDVSAPIQIASFDPDFHDASNSVQPLPFAKMTDRYPMFNGRGYPDTVNTDNLVNENGYESQRVHSLIEAAPDQKILLRISSLSTTSFHTLTVLGIPMQVIGKGSRKLGPINDTSHYYYTNSVELGGGQAVDVLLDTAGIAPGTYFLYSTNLNHLSNNEEDYGGMMTEIRIQ